MEIPETLLPNCMSFLRRFVRQLSRTCVHRLRRLTSGTVKTWTPDTSHTTQYTKSFNTQHNNKFEGRAILLRSEVHVAGLAGLFKGVSRNDYYKSELEGQHSVAAAMAKKRRLKLTLAKKHHVKLLPHSRRLQCIPRNLIASHCWQTCLLLGARAGAGARFNIILLHVELKED